MTMGLFEVLILKNKIIKLFQFIKKLSQKHILKNKNKILYVIVVSFIITCESTLERQNF